MHPNEEAMLEADDAWLGNLIGKEGLLILVNLMFWMMCGSTSCSDSPI